MFASQVLSLLLWCVLKLIVARRIGPEDGEILEKISSARCTSRCLTLHITQLTATFKHLQSDEVLGWCENHRRCSQCLQPCRELWETRSMLSQKFCEKHHECITSAEFLLLLQSLKQGDCPAPQKASGFAAACVEGCTSDRDCSTTRKCCSNSCGHTCQAPANLYKGVPLKPRKDMTFLENQRGHVEVAWMSKFNVSMEAVLYILQRRWNDGIHPSEDHASPWQTILMTMEERAVMKDVRPHRWYQFRVSAVNSQGTRGFTTPSKHFSSTRDPFPPEPPQNLRVGNHTVHADGSVSVRLWWDPPSQLDLPLHHYKLTWNAHSAPAGGVSWKEKGRIVDGGLSGTELDGLQPDLSYMVHIQAVALWGQKRLKSRRAQISFTTASPTASLPGRETVSQDVSNELPASRSSPSVLRLETAAPHYHDNQLQVKVFWKSRLPGLLFACKYRVAVKAESAGAQTEDAVTSVVTPQCSTLKGRRKRPLPCAQEERHLQAKKALQRPEKLTAVFQTVNGSLDGIFSWQMSEAAQGQTRRTGFRFSCVRVSSNPVNDWPDTLFSHTLHLAPGELSLRVGHLQPDSVYEVQVQVLCEAGSGPSVVRTFHTPPLLNTSAL